MDLEIEIVSAEKGKLQIIIRQRGEGRDTEKFHISNETTVILPRHYGERHPDD